MTDRKKNGSRSIAPVIEKTQEPDPYEQATTLEVQQEQVSRWRKEESKWIWRLFFLLLLTTVYMFALNAIVLARTTPRPYTLQLPNNFKDTSRYSYGVLVRWSGLEPSTGIGAPPVRPRVLVNGAQVAAYEEDKSKVRATASGDQPAAHEENKRKKRALALVLEKSHKVEIRIPSGCSEGRHEGRLELHRLLGDPSSPKLLTTKVSVGVRTSLWSNWFLVRIWLFVALVVWGGVYVACVFIFPRPCGSLGAREFAGSLAPTSGSGAQRRRRLRMRRLAWVFPWTRSYLDLGWLLKKLKIGAPRGLSAELWFGLDHYPPSLQINKGRTKIRKRSRSGDRPTNKNTTPVGSIVQMHDTDEFYFQYGANQDVTIFWNSQKIII